MDLFLVKKTLKIIAIPTLKLKKTYRIGQHEFMEKWSFEESCQAILQSAFKMTFYFLIFGHTIRFRFENADNLFHDNHVAWLELRKKSWQMYQLSGYIRSVHILAEQLTFNQSVSLQLFSIWLNIKTVGQP